MAVKLKPLEGQVIVITGASSGIGLATARKAAKAGAAVVLAARNAEALRAVCEDIEADGGRPRLVEGTKMNQKITTVEDLILMRVLFEHAAQASAGGGPA